MYSEFEINQTLISIPSKKYEQVRPKKATKNTQKDLHQEKKKENDLSEKYHEQGNECSLKNVDHFRNMLKRTFQYNMGNKIKFSNKVINLVP